MRLTSPRGHRGGGDKLAHLSREGSQAHDAREACLLAGTRGRCEVIFIVPAAARAMRELQGDRASTKLIILVEAVVAALSHDDVIQNADAEYLTRRDQATGHLVVFDAGSRISARMIVNQDYGRGRGAYCGTKDLSGMNQTRGQSALRDLGLAHHSVSPVEQQYHEVLSPEVPHALVEVVIDVGGLPNRVARLQAPARHTAANLQRGEQRAGFSWPHAGNLAQLREGHLAKRTEPSTGSE